MCKLCERGDIRKALADSSKRDPRERFQDMVDAGLIDSDGKLRRSESQQASASGNGAAKK